MASFLSNFVPPSQPHLLRQPHPHLFPVRTLFKPRLYHSSSPSSLKTSNPTEAEENTPSSSPSTGVVSVDEPASTIPAADFRECKTCGKEEIEKGCNGEGRIQGGIATVPGFGWWPIKAFRPCPGFIASGGRYKRRGQTMDEVASGGGGRDSAAGISTD
ncbi:hypothetical protein J5N97_026089 [Dioscorea zingiberensis]|uniref:Uncharacterized protein n=1 Tax=Dioscorea zingiberensis TaxID=325984 RepID=A0A9D5H6D9_9LILI|nr:hypothetical protein J5N97_026089 [Dioscorea zingiberensis]